MKSNETAGDDLYQNDFVNRNEFSLPFCAVLCCAALRYVNIFAFRCYTLNNQFCRYFIFSSIKNAAGVYMLSAQYSQSANLKLEKQNTRRRIINNALRLNVLKIEMKTKCVCVKLRCTGKDYQSVCKTGIWGNSTEAKNKTKKKQREMFGSRNERSERQNACTMYTSECQ